MVNNQKSTAEILGIRNDESRGNGGKKLVTYLTSNTKTSVQLNARKDRKPWRALITLDLKKYRSEKQDGDELREKIDGGGREKQDGEEESDEMGRGETRWGNAKHKGKREGGKHEKEEWGNRKTRWRGKREAKWAEEKEGGKIAERNKLGRN